MDRDNYRLQVRWAGNLGVVVPRHADHFRIRPSRPDLHPVVVQQLDVDIASRQELDVLNELPSRHGGRTRLLDVRLRFCGINHNFAFAQGYGLFHKL